MVVRDHNDLSAAISAALSEYNDEVVEALEKAKDKIAKDAVKELRSAGSFRNRSGALRRGWKTTKQGTAIVIHNKEAYAHLVNNGHAKRNGGRTKAFDFVGPIESEAIQKFEDEVVRQLGG